MRTRRSSLRHFLCLLYIGALAAGGLSTATGQDDEATVRRKTHLTAERTIFRVIDGKDVVKYYGNVVVDRDSLDARSDSAVYYVDEESYELLGNVRLRQGSSILYCRHALYSDVEGAGDYHGDVRVEEGEVIGTSYRAESRNGGLLLRMIGDARLVSPEYTVWGDTIARDRELAQGEAFGNVKVLDPESHTLVTGRHAVFSEDGDVARVDLDPVLLSREQRDKPLESRAGIMTFYNASEMAVMVDSVQIRQGRMQAWADTAVVYGQERVVLIGSPRVSVDENSLMTAREIEFLYREGALYRIFLRGDGRMEDSTPDSLAEVFSGLPTMNILEGDTITVELDDEEIDRSVVVGNARSLYVPEDVIDEVAFNDVKGDTIIINFRAGKVKRVDVTGNMSGQYTFARIAQMVGQGQAVAAALAAADDSTGSDLLGQAAAAAAEYVDTGTVADSTMALVDSVASEIDLGPRDFNSGSELAQYSGHSVVFLLDDQRIDIAGDAELVYGSMTLTADEVAFDTNRRELYAQGDPLLVDKGEDVAGEQMGYNFDSRAGAVRHGVTKSAAGVGGESYYSGEEIRRFDDGTLKIVSGCMTACDLAKPHYHFASNRMRIKMKDKMAAAPIVLKIGEVPVFALPFFFKSLKTDRRSGILFPSFNFGWSSRDGRYIRDFGYYWATNDYMDFALEFDYNERNNFAYRLTNRYRKRYAFDGNISYNDLNVFEGSNKRREWTFGWDHSQEALFDEYRFRANVRMSSTELSRDDLSADAGRDLVRGQNKSNVYLSRSWDMASANASLSRTEYINVSDDDASTNGTLYTQTLPNISLSLKRTALMPPSAPGSNGSFLGNVLRNTYFNQSYRGGASRTARELNTTDVYTGNANMSLDINPPRISIFNVSAGVTSARGWTRTTDSGRAWTAGAEEDDPGTYSDVDSTDVQITQSLSFRTTVNTKLYGVMPLKVGRVQALRHTVGLSVGQTLSPSLGARQSRSENYSLSLTNRFDVKYLSYSEKDSTYNEEKLDGILDWGLSTSFNPEREPGARWSTIGSVLNLRPGRNRNLNLKVNNSIDPSTWQLTRTSFSYGIRFEGRLDTGGHFEAVVPERNSAIDRLGAPDSTAVNDGEATDEDIWAEMEDAVGAESYEMELDDRDRKRGGHDDGPDLTEGGRFLPWNLSTNLSYSKSKSSDASARANVNFNTSLSRLWSFKYSASFDLAAGSTTRQSYSLTRDLHCWRMEFSRIVSSVDQQFGFRIYLLSVPEVKLTRGREGLLGGLGGGGLY